MKIITIFTILILLLVNTEFTFSQNTKKNDAMKITDIKDVKIKETPHKVDVRLLYDHETAQAVHIELKPGESLKPHITPVDVFFYILEGEPSIMIGEETKTVYKDQLVESPKDIRHCIYNHAKKKARILVVKAPKQTSSSKIL